MQVRFNSKVKPTDTTYPIGDFSLESDPKQVERKYIEPLNGTHIFIMGSHDRWLRRHLGIHYLIEKEFTSIGYLKVTKYIVMCHYAMLKWPRSHYGSLQLFGHSHGRLDNELPRPYNRKSQVDVGVDTNDFKPYSLDEILTKLKGEKDAFRADGDHGRTKPC